jgi:flagellar biosynthesis/type III secretory pathway protein FliH
MRITSGLRSALNTAAKKVVDQEVQQQGQNFDTWVAGLDLGGGPDAAATPEQERVILDAYQKLYDPEAIRARVVEVEAHLRAKVERAPSPPLPAPPKPEQRKTFDWEPRADWQHAIPVYGMIRMFVDDASRPSPEECRAQMQEEMKRVEAENKRRQEAYQQQVAAVYERALTEALRTADKQGQ